MTVNKLNYTQSYLIAPIKPPLAFISSQLYLKYSLKVIKFYSQYLVKSFIYQF